MTMKLSTMAAVAMALSLASCSSEEVAMPTEENVNVSFAVSLPSELQTRATFGDGSQAAIDKIEYVVYKVTGDNDETLTFLYESSQTETVTEINDKIIIDIPMVKQFKYRVIFYAHNSGISNVSRAKEVLTINYSGISPNDDKMDVYVGDSGVVEVINEATTDLHEIALKRPFAQLNWGTTAIDEISKMGTDEGGSTPADGEGSETTPTEKKSVIDTMTATVTVSSGLYTKYNILEDKVIEESKVTSSVTFTAVSCNKLPEVDFPVEGYKLVAMNYILVGKGEGTDTGTIDCSIKFDWTDNDEPQTRTTTVNSAPCKANYRTNIYGNLIMTPEQFECTINRAFNNDDSGAHNITGDKLQFPSSNPINTEIETKN